MALQACPPAAGLGWPPVPCRAWKVGQHLLLPVRPQARSMSDRLFALDGFRLLTSSRGGRSRRAHLPAWWLWGLGSGHLCSVKLVLYSPVWAWLTAEEAPAKGMGPSASWRSFYSATSGANHQCRHPVHRRDCFGWLTWNSWPVKKTCLPAVVPYLPLWFVLYMVTWVSVSYWRSSTLTWGSGSHERAQGWLIMCFDTCHPWVNAMLMLRQTQKNEVTENVRCER